jgi:hypothetical protein
MRRVILLAAALAALALPAVSGAEPLTFNPPQYLDQTFPGGEPVLDVDTIHHTIVYSSHEGTTHVYRNGVGVETLQWATEYRNQTKMWISKDGGLTWSRLDFMGTGFTTDPTKNTGFSDPDFAEDAGGRIYNTGINLANDALFSSGDGGFNWDKGTVFCASGDRPWLAGGKPGEVFMGTNTNAGGHEIFVSEDGGNSCPTSFVSDNGDGKLYYDHTRDVIVEPAVPGSGSELGINVWHRGDAKSTYMKAIDGTSLYAHWPAIAIDGAGTIYLVWDTVANDANGNPLPNKVLMVYTKDLGKTWSAPTTIAAPTEARVFWPWIAAGDQGKVSVVWYQTDHLVDVGTQPSKLFIYDANVRNADTSTPTIDTVNAAGRVVSDAQQICQNGTTCVATGEDRRLGDFFTNAIDERGCVIIASGDTMIKDPVTGGERNVSAPLFIRQATGPRLIGSGNCSGQPEPATPPAKPGKPVTNPPSAGVPLPSNKRCTSARRFRIRLRAPKGQTLASAKVYVSGKRVRVARRAGRLTAIVDLRGLRKRAYSVKIVAVTGQGRSVTSSRRYHTCKRGHKKK